MCRECCCGHHYGGWKHGHEHGHRHRHHRRFFTKAEKVEKLKSYAEELRKELKGIEEQIKELQS